MLHPAKARLAALRELKCLARPAGTFDASRYFRGAESLGFYNVGTAVVRQMARALDADTRDAWSIKDATAFADLMLGDRYLEAKAVGLELLARRHREFGPWLLPVCKRWLAGNLSANWATTDSLCGSVLGPMLVREQRLLEREMPKWARHRNMWVRRAAAVACLRSIRRGLAIDTGYAIAAMLHGDGEDLIQKAVGWMLRDLGDQDMERLARYLRANGLRIPRTTVRYAIEHFPLARRRELLEATRAPSSRVRR